jgi:tetratricopeptide (TPR) repeat protein
MHQPPAYRPTYAPPAYTPTGGPPPWTQEEAKAWELRAREEAYRTYERIAHRPPPPDLRLDLPPATEEPPRLVAARPPSLGVDPYSLSQVEPVYDQLGERYGFDSVDAYLEQQGASALLGFEEGTEDPIMRLARGLIPDAPPESVVEEALANPDEDASPATEGTSDDASQVRSGQAAHHYLEGMRSLYLNVYDDAVQSYLASWEAALEGGDKPYMARSAQQLAELADWLGADAKASEWYARSTAVYRKLARESFEGGDHDEARELYTEVLNIANRMADLATILGSPMKVLHAQALVAKQLSNLALAVRNQGDEEEGRQLLELSRDAFRLTIEEAREQDLEHKLLDQLQDIRWVSNELEDKRGEAYALHRSGMKALFEGKPDEARKLFDESLAINEDLGDQEGVAENLLYTGISAFYQDEFDEAYGLLGRSLAISDGLGAEKTMGESLLWLANVAFEEDDPDEGRRLLRKGTEEYEQFKPATVVPKLDEYAKLAREMDKEDMAGRLDERAREILVSARPSYFGPSYYRYHYYGEPYL